MRKGQLKALTNLKRLPGFEGRTFRDVEIEPAVYERVKVSDEVWCEGEDGEPELLEDAVFENGELLQKSLVARVWKARARNTVPVSARLIALIGPELYALIAHSDDDDPEGNPLAALLDIDHDDPAAIKSIFMTTVMPLLQSKMGELMEDGTSGSIVWYFEKILGGQVEYDGCRPDSFDDLDAMGFTVPHLMRLFWSGVELAFFPTRGGLGTSTGPSSPSPPETPPDPNKSSSPGESQTMTGHSVRMSKTRG